MSWKQKPPSELMISEGLAKTLEERLKVTQCGPLAAAMSNGQISAISHLGPSVLDVITRELVAISGGEYKPAVDGKMEVKDVEAAQPAMAQAVKNQTDPKPETPKNEEVKDGKAATAKDAKQEPLPLTVSIPASEVKAYEDMRGVAERIVAQQRRVRELKSKWKDQKDRTKDAKNAYEADQDTLLEMIDELTDPQQRLPTMSALKEPKKEKKTTTPAPAAAEEAPKTSGRPDWATESVTCLMGDKLGRSSLQKLIDAGIGTMGQLELAFRENRVYTIPDMKKHQADKVRERAFAWLNDNRPKEEPKPGTEIVLLKDIHDESGKMVLESGAHVQKADYPDGSVGCVHNGVSIKLGKKDWAPAPVPAEPEKPKTVQITKPVPGADNDQDELYPGYEAEVVGWNGPLPIVKTATQRQVEVPADHFVGL